MKNIFPYESYYTDTSQGVMMTKIGILHPGTMGVSIAASAINSRNKIYWASVTPVQEAVL